MRQVIIERVAREQFENNSKLCISDIKWDYLQDDMKAAYRGLASGVLDGAGFFTLLEAVEVFTEEKTNNVPHAWKQLDAAVAKAKGITP